MKREEFIRKVRENHGLQLHGMIFEVKNGFLARSTNMYMFNTETKQITKNSKDNYEWVYKSIYVKKGSFIEFRYEHDAHCRDIDNNYFMIDASILAIKCEPFAKIKEKTSWNNNKSLKEILDEKLHDLKDEY